MLCWLPQTGEGGFKEEEVSWGGVEYWGLTLRLVRNVRGDKKHETRTYRTRDTRHKDTLRRIGMRYDVVFALALSVPSPLPRRANGQRT